jgi:lysophospholipase L1-like esterase
VSRRRAGRAGRWLAALVAVVVSGALVRGHVVPRFARGPVPAVSDLNHDGEVRIACLGDSNTQLLHVPAKWCELVQDAVRERAWKTFNYGFTGTTITRTGRTLPDGTPLYASMWIARARTEVAPDVAVLAYLTNDVLIGVAPGIAVDALEYEYDLLRHHGLRVLVALCPPFFPKEADHSAAVAEINRRIVEAFPAVDVIDFHDGMVAADYGPDGIHIKGSGQEKRAAAALAALVGR